MRKKKNINSKTLSWETTVRVRFSEVDSMAITWHGSYVKFMEDAREAFGKQFKLGYLDVYEQGYMTPLVNLNIDYKKPLLYGDELSVKITFIDSPAAKIQFEYEMTNTKTGELVVTAETTQIFMNKERELELIIPDFFADWKKINLN